MPRHTDRRHPPPTGESLTGCAHSAPVGVARYATEHSGERAGGRSASLSDQPAVVLCLQRGHDVSVPDSSDYVWLGWLIAHPDEWTSTDLARAESIVADQNRAVDESHPKDAAGRERLRAVADALESAIAEHHRRRAP